MAAKYHSKAGKKSSERWQFECRTVRLLKVYCIHHLITRLVWYSNGPCSPASLSNYAHWKSFFVRVKKVGQIVFFNTEKSVSKIFIFTLNQLLCLKVSKIIVLSGKCYTMQKGPKLQVSPVFQWSILYGSRHLNTVPFKNQTEKKPDSHKTQICSR
jgi:hypothetical protein